MAQHSLFSQQIDIPLAEKLRPKTLEDYFGQKHIIGKGSILSIAIAQKRPFSMLLWGPPGCGKTTLALLLAKAFNAEFIKLSAVFCGVKEVREAVAQAQTQRSVGRQTLLFIDEIHRFNKAQQDAFLPYVEDGTIILIGATTENPAFNLNNALLSRLKVLHFKPLNEAALLQTLQKALTILKREDLKENKGLSIIAYQAAGDARKAIAWLEEWILLQSQNISAEDALNQALAEQPKALDKQGDWFYELLSAFHKSLRGSHPDGALYWFARMVEGGADPLIICRRMLCVASEDIGNADPNALNLALNTYQTFERLGAPEGYLSMAQCITYLALAPKSNAAYKAMKAAFAYVKENPAYPVPPHLRNAPTQLHQQENHGQGYRYAHDELYAYSAGQTYLPNEMKNIKFYQPNDRGFEQKFAEKMKKLNELDLLFKQQPF
ncbi:replication-associated recombination protein A [Suttonella ornithocola]|uniref:Replication-associated recombination protein A n=1 Tax=Suttonella ornithocola TaxID=279832 RepID=A0A380MN85_9GAMM|nr:replication-associated recombination protein A [Suttonella ornithocola]SUO93506.1 Replication-associated recombination protein A [Suttonella ornithocola]